MKPEVFGGEELRAVSHQNTSPQPPLTGQPSIGKLFGSNNLHTGRLSNARQTSIASYIALKEEGELGRKQLEVLKYIAAHPFSSDREISVGLGMAINCVCGRRTEILKYGLIREKGRKYDDVTNRDVLVWGLI
jgi:hypothetical protein